jgi:hypothetical protein
MIFKRRFKLVSKCFTSRDHLKRCFNLWNNQVLSLKHFYSFLTLQNLSWSLTFWIHFDLYFPHSSLFLFFCCKIVFCSLNSLILINLQFFQLSSPLWSLNSLILITLISLTSLILTTLYSLITLLISQLWNSLNSLILINLQFFQLSSPLW